MSVFTARRGLWIAVLTLCSACGWLVFFLAAFLGHGSLPLLARLAAKPVGIAVIVLGFAAWLLLVPAITTLLAPRLTLLAGGLQTLVPGLALVVAGCATNHPPDLLLACLAVLVPALAATLLGALPPWLLQARAARARQRQARAALALELHARAAAPGAWPPPPGATRG